MKADTQKRSRGFRSISLIPLMFVAADLLAVFLSYRVSLTLWLGELNREPANFIVFSPVIPFYLFVITFISMKYQFVYDDRRYIRDVPDTVRYVRANCVVLITILALSYALKLYHISRVLILLYFFISTTFISLFRHIIKYLRALLRRYGLDICRVLIVGHNDISMKMKEGISNRTGASMRIVGILGGGVETMDLQELERKVSDLAVEEVLICEPEKDISESIEILSMVERTGVRVRILHPDLAIIARKVPIGAEYFMETPIVEFRSGSDAAYRKAAKQLFDILFSFSVVCAGLPLWVVIALAIKLQDGGSIFFRQRRIGMRGKEFEMFKFRTMVPDAEDRKKELEHLNELEGHMFKIRSDPRITRVGRLLRKYSLDEFPQFINVLKGNISVIGNRPPTVEEYESYEIWHRKRTEGWMGITGLWQVCGRNTLTFDQMVLLDIYYNKNFSIFLDIAIANRTLWVVLVGRGAY